MDTISAVALKGGTAKTTTIHNLAGALSLAGHRVLAIDNDPQASLTSGMFGAGVAEQLDPSTTIAAIYAGDDPLPGKVIRPSGIDRVDLLAGSMAAAEYNITKPYLAPASEQLSLRSFLAEVRDDYDYVLIDNPPNLQGANWKSIMASDYAFVPVVPEDYGSMSLSPVLELLASVVAGPNPGLHMLGLVLTMVQPRIGVHAAYETMLREIHGDKVFSARIASAADVKEAISANLPITHFKRKGASSKAFIALAAEIEARIAAGKAVGQGAGAPDVSDASEAA